MNLTSTSMGRTHQTKPRLASGRQRGGFTILELLLVLAIIAILLGIGFITFGRLNERLSLESATSELGQAIMQGRNQALRSGNNFRVIVENNTRYSIQEEQDGDWLTRRTFNLPSGVTIISPATNATIEFDTRGFANFAPLNLIYRLTDGRQTLSLAPAMSGNTRIL